LYKFKNKKVAKLNCNTVSKVARESRLRTSRRTSLLEKITKKYF